MVLPYCARWLSWGVSCAATGLLTLSSTPALAARGHGFASFGTEGAGTGQFVEPAGVAVRDSTGEVYVVDRGNNRIERFSSGGAYLSQFNGGEGHSLLSPTGIAVDNASNVLEDPSAGNVYVVDRGHNAIDKFDAAGNFLGLIAEGASGPLGEVDGVAVDPKGVVWVYQASGEIDSYQPYKRSRLR
jgi:DNA-binding beta-propeller fold protein YncE